MTNWEEVSDKIIAHRFATAMIKYFTTGIQTDEEVIEFYNQKDNQRLTEITKILLDEGFKLSDMSTWEPWLKANS